MIQAIIPTYCPDVVRDHRFIPLPFCTGCERNFTEAEFLALPSDGYNIVWDIEYAICPDCARQVQGWRLKTQAWRGR